MDVVAGRPARPKVVGPDEDHLVGGKADFWLEGEAAFGWLEGLAQLVGPALGHGVLLEEGYVLRGQDLAAEGPNQQRDDRAGDLLAGGRYGIFNV